MSPPPRHTRRSHRRQDLLWIDRDVLFSTVPAVYHHLVILNIRVQFKILSDFCIELSIMANWSQCRAIFLDLHCQSGLLDLVTGARARKVINTLCSRVFSSAWRNEEQITFSKRPLRAHLCFFRIPCTSSRPLSSRLCGVVDTCIVYVIATVGLLDCVDEERTTYPLLLVGPRGDEAIESPLNKVTHVRR